MALLHAEYFSEALHGWSVTVDVILPEEEPPAFGYRTLWLLHGMSDDETVWQRMTSIERYAAVHHIAVVMPAVQISCYSDMSHGFPYYTFVSDELPRVMREMFPLSARREDNYIAGLSMGGEGAMKIGLSKPENYAAIGCLSAGAFNHPWSETFNEQENNVAFLCHDGKTLSGLPEDCFENAKKILAQGKPIPQIYHAIGSNDFLLESAKETRDFFESLEGNPFGYVYEENPGAHTWEFWDTHITHYLDFIDGNRKKDHNL